LHSLEDPYHLAAAAAAGGGLATSITTQHTAQLTSMHDDVDGTFEF